MRISPIFNNVNLYKFQPKVQQTFKGRDFSMFRLSNEDLDYKTLSIDNKEYIVAKTLKSQEPLVIKPDIVDSFLRDKNGNINEKILKAFCFVYDEMIIEQEKHDYSVQDFYGGALKSIQKNKQNISQVGIDGNIIDFNFQQKQKDEKQKLDRLEAQCKAVLAFEEQKPKNIQQDALEQTIIFMQLCKKPDGYKFSDYYEQYGHFEDKIKKARELHFFSKRYNKDVATPLIKYATCDAKDSCDMLLLHHLTDFYNTKSNRFDFSSIEKVCEFLLKTGTKRENHTWTIVDRMIELSKYVNHNSPEFMFFLDKTIDKETCKFHKETIDAITEMFKMLQNSKDLLKAEYSNSYNGQFYKKSERIVKEYLKLYCDEKTGELMPNSPNAILFCLDKLKEIK